MIPGDKDSCPEESIIINILVASLFHLLVGPLKRVYCSIFVCRESSRRTLGSEGTITAVLKNATGPTNSRTLLITFSIASFLEMGIAVKKKTEKVEQ